MGEPLDYEQAERLARGEDEESLPSLTDSDIGLAAPVRDEIVAVEDGDENVCVRIGMTSKDIIDQFCSRTCHRGTHNTTEMLTRRCWLAPSST